MDATAPTPTESWNARAELVYTGQDPTMGDPDPVMAADPCPPWCGDSTEHTRQLRFSDRRHESGSVTVPLSRHLGVRFSDHQLVQEARADVHLELVATERRATIALTRYAGRRDGTFGMVDNSTYRLELDEAQELAAVLLAAVAAARESYDRGGGTRLASTPAAPVDLDDPSAVPARAGRFEEPRHLPDRPPAGGQQRAS